MLWNVLECCGMLWNVVECFKMLWNVVECFRMLWNVVECCGMLWNVVECCGMFLSKVLEIFGTIQPHGSLYVICCSLNRSTDENSVYFGISVNHSVCI